MTDAQNTLADYFSYFTEKHQVVTWKLDLKYYQDGESGEPEWWEIAEDHFHIAMNFTTDTLGEVVASSVGMHLDGKNKKPHVHFHFVVNEPYKPLADSAKSMRKVRWLKDRDPQDSVYMKHMTVAYSPFDTDKPKWSVLAYPLKEGKRGDIRMYRVIRPGAGMVNMPVEIIDLLEVVATTIYQTAVAVRERNEKAEKKREDNLQELYDWAVKERSGYNNFREMQEHFEDKYLFKIVETEGLHALPDVVNYNRNLKKVGRALGIFRYMDDLSGKL